MAERIDVATAARELILYESQLYNRRSKQQQQMISSERESELAAENARLKRQLTEQAEELVITQNGRDILREAPKPYAAFSGLPEAAGMRGSNVAINPAHACSSSSSVILLSVRHSLKQSSVMERLASPKNCLNTISKPSLPACDVRDCGQKPAGSTYPIAFPNK